MADGKIKSYNSVRAKIFGKKPTKVQWIISRWSRPQVHNEYEFSERYDHISFSATMADGSKCARFKTIEYSHERERWDSVVVPMTDEQEDSAWAEAKKLEGTPYDIVGQLCHLTPLEIWKPSPKKIWCTTCVGRLVYKGRPDFFHFLMKTGLVKELRPDQMDMLARYFFELKPVA